MFKNDLNTQNTPVNTANRALSPYIDIWQSVRHLLQSQIKQVASWPDWQSSCTCCYRNGDDRHHSAVQRAEIQPYCRYYIYRLYLHQLEPVRPRNSFFSEFHTKFFHPPSSLFWEGIMYCKVVFVSLSREFPRVSFLAFFAKLHPFPGALCPPWHGAVPGSLQGAPRNISSGAPRSRPQSPRTNHKQNLQWRNMVVQLTKSGWESLYNRAA